MNHCKMMDRCYRGGEAVEADNIQAILIMKSLYDNK